MRAVRNLSRYALVILALTIAATACMATIADATTYKQHQVFVAADNGYVVVPTAPFQAFGNTSGVGDCQYETAANLTLAEYPKAKITTSQVEGAFSTYGDLFQGQQVTTDGGQDWTLTGLWAGQNYLIDHGYDGHRASVTQVTTRYAEVQGANHGGLEVTATGPNLMHMFGILQANAQRVTVVDDGVIYHYSWTALATHYDFGGDTLAFYAVKWAA